MSRANTNTGEQLVKALHILGVKFIMGGKDSGVSPYKQPARLIATLNQSPRKLYLFARGKRRT
jgi:hypothetical protein